MRAIAAVVALLFFACDCSVEKAEMIGTYRGAATDAMKSVSLDWGDRYTAILRNARGTTTVRRGHWFFGRVNNLRCPEVLLDDRDHRFTVWRDSDGHLHLRAETGKSALTKVD